MKVRGRLGPDPRNNKNIRELNRTITWDNGIKHEADQRHVEIIVEAAKLEANSRSVATLGSREEAEGEETIDATAYRAIAAIVAYLGQDRADIQCQGDLQENVRPFGEGLGQS